MSEVSRQRTQALVITGLGVALLVAVFVSPFASSNPDGLDRVAQDLGFDSAAVEEAPSQKLPFYRVFEEYSLRGVPENLKTPLAGLIGTLVTFGLAWGIGKVAIKEASPPSTESDLSDRQS